MKGSSVIGKLIVVFLTLGVVVYFGAQGYRYAANPLTTTVAYAYATQTTVGVEGFVVREEAVIPTEGGLLRVVADEGARVAAGEVIATVYASSDALVREETLRALQEELLLKEWRMHGHVHENYSGDDGMGCGVGNSDKFYHWGGLLAYIALDNEDNKN